MTRMQCGLLGLMIALGWSETTLSQEAVGHDAGNIYPPSEQDLAKGKSIMPLIDPSQLPPASLRPSQRPSGLSPGAAAGSNGGAFQGSAPSP
jgi:hypothetical protein